MRKSSVVKCFLNSCTSAGVLGGPGAVLEGLGGTREGRASADWRTGVPGTLEGSFRDEWKGDQETPRSPAGEPGCSLPDVELEGSGTSASAIWHSIASSAKFCTRPRLLMVEEAWLRAELV